MTKLNIEQKNLSFQVKSIDEDLGIVTGYLSTFNNIDYQKDRVLPGAFQKTIQEALQRKSNKGKKYLWPLLFMHDPEKPVGGFIDASEDRKGLLVSAQLDISTNAMGIPNNPLATTVFSGFKAGYVDEFSIGYNAIQKDYDKEGIRNLKELRVVEGSAITSMFAADPEALVTGVKTIAPPGRKDKTMNDQKDFSDRYRQNRIANWMYSDWSNLTSALKSSIQDLFTIGDTPEPDLVDTVLNDTPAMGFISALKAYVQMGIDLNVTAYLSGQQDNDSMGFMSRDTSGVENKKLSKASASTLQDSIKTMQDSMMAHKAMTDMHYKTISNVSEDLSAILGSPAYTGEDQSGQDSAAANGKSNHGPISHKSPNSDQSLNSTEIDDDPLVAMRAWLAEQNAK